MPLPPLTLSTDVAPATKWNVLQLIDCSPLRSIPITGTSSLLWALLTSHSSLLLRLMGPPVRPPRLRCALFPLIYLPHLLVLPATFWTSSLLADLSVFPSLICGSCSSGQGFAYSFLQIPPHDGHHPLEHAHGAQTRKTDPSCTDLGLFHTDFKLYTASSLRASMILSFLILFELRSMHRPTTANTAKIMIMYMG